MTIGGNDSGVFAGSIAQCGAAGLATLGQGSPCKDTYGSSFETTVRRTRAGHSACAGSSPSPNALGESRMATQTMHVLGLR